MFSCQQAERECIALRQHAVIATKKCAVCEEECDCAKIMSCLCCHRTYHTKCYKKRKTLDLDCQCSQTIVFLNGQLAECLNTHCLSPNTKNIEHLWCVTCTTELVKKIEFFLLESRQVSIPIIPFINNYIESVHMKHTKINIAKCEINNLLRLQLFSVLYKIIMRSLFIVLAQTHGKVCIQHIFNLLTTEMKTTRKTYMLPLDASEFTILQPLESSPDLVSILKAFRTHCYHFTADSDPILITANSISYQTQHQEIKDQDSLLKYITTAGIQGLYTQSLYAMYENCIHDLRILTQQNRVWISGDKRVVYAQSIFPPVIPGLAALCQRLVSEPTQLNPHLNPKNAALNPTLSVKPSAKPKKPTCIKTTNVSKKSSKQKQQLKKKQKMRQSCLKSHTKNKSVL